MSLPYILIPSYQPGPTLLHLVEGLLAAGLAQILVVDDGSGSAYQAIFTKLSACIKVLTHTVNQGKGAAIKTGLGYLQAQKISTSVITVDGDGQHLLEDVQKIYKAAVAHPEQFILGVRQFDPSVPFRSRFGNELSRWVFRYLHHYLIEDTQTGLRALPVPLQADFVNIPWNRYEFESACLIQAVRSGQSILQIPIQTVYLDHNASSHFRPILDSLRIYSVFFRFRGMKCRQ